MTFTLMLVTALLAQPEGPKDAEGSAGELTFKVTQRCAGKPCAYPHDAPIEAEVSVLRGGKVVARGRANAPKGNGTATCKVTPNALALTGAVTALIEVSADAMTEGQSAQSTLFAFAGDALKPLLQFTSKEETGEGYPNTHARGALVAMQTPGDVQLVESSDVCDDPTTCRESATITKYACTASSCTKKGTVKPRAHIRYATASSTLKEPSLGADFYSAEKAIDDSPDSAWAEGASGFGKGEHLDVELVSWLKLTSMTISAGCGNAKIWPMNHRLKRVKVTYADGSSEDVELKDVRSQTVPLHAKAAGPKFSLTLLDVYRGSKFDDACISDLSVDGSSE